MSRSWLQFAFTYVSLVTAFTVAGCGMRTLDLVDERRSNTTGPADASVPDVSNTNGGGTSSSSNPANTTAPSGTGPSVVSPPQNIGDGGVGLPDAGPSRLCSDERPYYDSISGTCLECQSDRHCPDLPGGVEQLCQWGGYCDFPCDTNNDCRYAFFCSEEGRCLECLSDRDCSTRYGEARPFCHVQGRCIECESNADCEGRYGGARPVCDEFYNWCREECITDAHCPPDEPICDDVTRTCRVCTNDRDCPFDAPVCGTLGRCTTTTPSSDDSDDSP